MHESEKWKWSRSVVSDSQLPHGLQPTRLLCPWDFPGKSTGVGAIAFSRNGAIGKHTWLLVSPYINGHKSKIKKKRKGKNEKILKRTGKEKKKSYQKKKKAINLKWTFTLSHLNNLSFKSLISFFLFLKGLAYTIPFRPPPHSHPFAFIILKS